MSKNIWKRILALMLACCILAGESGLGAVYATETVTDVKSEVATEDAVDVDSETIAEVELETTAEEKSEATASLAYASASDSDSTDTIDLSETMIIGYGAGPSSGPQHSAYTQEQQIAYVEEQLKTAWDSFSETCTFSFQYHITQSILQTAVSNLLYENYQYCYISSTCSLTYHMGTAYVTAATFSYTMTESEAAEAVTDLEEAIDAIVDTVDSDWSELEIALYLNDTLARICEYDTSYEYFSAYDVLVRGTAVCQGYALAYRILAEELGLSCELVTSESLNHIWNIVQVNGTWYHVDVTWNDPTADRLGRADHTYFLKSTSYFASSSGGHAANDWTFTGDVSDDDASDTTYDNYFWNSVTTGFEYVNGLWYAISGTSLNSYTCDGSAFKKKATILTISDTWYKWGTTTSLSGNYASLASYNGVLYYSLSGKIYSYKPSTAKTATVYTLASPYSSLGYIYGIRVTLDGELQFYLATGTSSSGAVGIYTAKQLDSSVANLIDATITLSSTSYTYNGSAKKPTVTVKYGSKTLTKGTHYTVSYSNNTAIGTGYVTITGIGNYMGTVMKGFTIKLGTTTISSAKNTTSGVKVTWSKVTGASGYYVYRKVSGGSYSKVKTISGTSTVSWTDSSLTSGKTYYYKIKAYYGSTTTTSSAASIKYLTAGVISSLTNITSGVKITWTKVSGASGYYVYRKTSGGSFSKIATITSGSTVTYTDTKVKSKNATTYIYCVKAYSGSTTSSYKSKTTVRLTTPTLSSVTNSASKKMTVKWSKVSSVTGYQIQYATTSTFSSYKTVTVSGASSVSKVISSLTKGKTYYVRLRTYKTVSGTKYYSAWSSKKSVKISK